MDAHKGWILVLLLCSGCASLEGKSKNDNASSSDIDFPIYFAERSKNATYKSSGALFSTGPYEDRGQILFFVRTDGSAIDVESFRPKSRKVDQKFSLTSKKDKDQFIALMKAASALKEYSNGSFDGITFEVKFMQKSGKEKPKDFSLLMNGLDSKDPNAKPYLKLIDDLLAFLPKNGAK